MDDSREQWNEWSDEFQAIWTPDQSDELPPATVHYGAGYPEDRRLDPFPQIEGTDVVELGCGGGQASVGFARHGAGSVTGVDFSSEQVRHASRLPDHYGVEADFVVGDVTRLPFADYSFDIAFSAYVFQLVENLQACLGEACRVLRDGGTLVFSVPHPFARLFDPESHEPTGSYFEVGPERTTVADLGMEVIEFHRRVGDYHEALFEAGFAVEELLEPGSRDPEYYRKHGGQEPELFAKVPPTLVFRAVKE